MTGREQRQVRNDTIEEMCEWLESCISKVDPESDVHTACGAMVKAMRAKKISEPGQDFSDPSYPGETRYPVKK
jgi:hypothetical protein